ncbi:hypothetical protein KKH43_02540 [Patescibacteria group bacterium]|nr:hypothetical protein [Patescibacteria group bacterium]
MGSTLALFLLFVLSGCFNRQEVVTEEVTDTYQVDSQDKKWSSDKSKGAIPDTAIAGKINGEEVTIQDVQISTYGDEYSWSFSNEAPEKTCGMMTDNNEVNFSSIALKEGTFEKAMDEEVDFDEYHAYYMYQQENGTPMSVNVDWAAKVVVDSVDGESNTVTGFARFDFGDGETLIEGKFTADLCE